MTRDEARIELAERMLISFKGDLFPTHFDPFTNSADCDALIDFMVEQEFNYDLDTISDTALCQVVFRTPCDGITFERLFRDWSSRHEAITLCALEALGIECDG